MANPKNDKYGVLKSLFQTFSQFMSQNTDSSKESLLDNLDKPYGGLGLMFTGIIKGLTIAMDKTKTKAQQFAAVNKNAPYMVLTMLTGLFSFISGGSFGNIMKAIVGPFIGSFLGTDKEEPKTSLNTSNNTKQSSDTSLDVSSILENVVPALFSPESSPRPKRKGVLGAGAFEAQRNVGRDSQVDAPLMDVQGQEVRRNNRI